MSKIIKTIAEINQGCNKKVITTWGEEDSQKIITADYDLVKTYVALKRYETYLATLISELQPSVTSLIKKNGTPPKDYANAKIQLTKRRTYDYTTDKAWTELNHEQERLKELRKKREDLLKNIQQDFIEQVDEETGELIRVYAPEVVVSEGVMVKL